MAAYLIIEGTIEDRAKWAEYRKAVLPLITQFGGKHLTKGGGLERLEGSRSDGIIALFEFSTMQAIRDFWNSSEYGRVKLLREGAADIYAVAAPGV